MVGILAIAGLFFMAWVVYDNQQQSEEIQSEIKRHFEELKDSLRPEK